MQAKVGDRVQLIVHGTIRTGGVSGLEKWGRGIPRYGEVIEVGTLPASNIPVTATVRWDDGKQERLHLDWLEPAYCDPPTLIGMCEVIFDIMETVTPTSQAKSLSDLVVDSRARFHLVFAWAQEFLNTWVQTDTNDYMTDVEAFTEKKMKGLGGY